MRRSDVICSHRTPSAGLNEFQIHKDRWPAGAPSRGERTDETWTPARERMAEDPKSEKYLDRYEVVAVALPGAALLLFVWYLHPELFGAAKFELKDVTVGALGIFTIAALYHTNCLTMLPLLKAESVSAVVTDPPYGLIEYASKEQRRLRTGNRGGIWRLPPAFDGYQRRPLPRFTVLSGTDRSAVTTSLCNGASLSCACADRVRISSSRAIP